MGPLPLHILTLLALIPHESGLGLSYNHRVMRVIRVEEGMLGKGLEMERRRKEMMSKIKIKSYLSKANTLSFILQNGYKPLLQ